LFANAFDSLLRDFAVDQVIFRVAHRPEAFIEAWQADQYALPVPSSIVVGHPADGPIGALTSCCRLLDCERILCVAGDVYFQVSSFQELRNFHFAGDQPMTVSIGHGTPTNYPSTLDVDESGCLTHFCRKELTNSDDLINAGLYVVDRNRVGWLIDDVGKHQTGQRQRAEYKEDNLWALTLRRPDRARFFTLSGTIVNVNTPEDLINAETLATARLIPSRGIISKDKDQ
jgi:NDP-sugar pyrophosphorylase family protein